MLLLRRLSTGTSDTIADDYRLNLNNDGCFISRLGFTAATGSLNCWMNSCA